MLPELKWGITPARDAAAASDACLRLGARLATGFDHTLQGGLGLQCWMRFQLVDKLSTS